MKAPAGNSTSTVYGIDAKAYPVNDGAVTVPPETAKAVERAGWTPVEAEAASL